MLMIRPVVRLISASLIALCAAAASAQNFPNKSIRIVTSAAGGTGDLVARLVAQGMSGPLGQLVIVENRGGGVVPPQIVAQSSPDGYSLLLYGNSLWLGPFLQKDVPYDPVKDFSPVSLAAISPQVLVVHVSLPINSVAELIAYAKASPGKLNFGGGANGSTAHLAAELFDIRTGVKMTHIFYKSTATSFSDLLAGQIQLMFATTISVAPQLKSGRLRALAVTSAQRSSLFPDLPTIAATLPGYEAVTIQGIFAPAHTPAAVIKRLNESIVQSLEKPDVKERFLAAGVEASGSSPAQFAAIIKADMTTMGKVIKDAGIHE